MRGEESYKMKNKILTLASLFDGFGGFPFGGLLSGIIPKWSSEVEPFPLLVTEKRLPFVKHMGDICKIDGAQVEPVDIITFGSPCTDMSIAGKRAGLEGKQSSLFYQAIRIIKEMREATNGEFPRYIVWENVPGAFSSNKGDDFKSVVQEIINIRYKDLSVPLAEKWEPAGLILEDDFSLAWRVLDAQYWGVPQRRKRIYLVADFTGGSAGKILFKCEGMSWNPPSCFRAWQGATRDSQTSTCQAGRICLNDQGGSRMDVSEDIIATLRATANHPPCIIDETIVLNSHPAGGRIEIDKDNIIQTLTSRMGTGGGNVPLLLATTTEQKEVCNKCFYEGAFGQTENAIASFVPQVFGICAKESFAMHSANPTSGFYKAEKTRTLDATGGNPGCNQGGMCVVALQGSMIGRDVKNGPKGTGINIDVSFTLDSTDRHAVVYSASKNSHFTTATENVAGTLVATDFKDPPLVNEGDHYIVRRLTPTECARLQGFPDWWCLQLETENPSQEVINKWREVFLTHSKINGKSGKAKSDNQIIKWLKNPSSDSAQYKMWGNGVALPNVVFVLSAIVRETLGEIDK